MDQSPVKTVHASVRPARVAILVDRSDADWQETSLRIIEFYSRLWGGAYNIIVPTDGSRISETFWTLLETFDPDHVFRYRKSGADLLLSQPRRYQEVLDAHTNAFLKKTGASDREGASAHIDKDMRQAWMEGRFEISSELQEEIKIRLAPFWFQRWTVNAAAITANSAPPFQLTKITRIIANTEHPNRIAVIEVPTNLLPSLWFSAVTGRIGPADIEAFEQGDVLRESFPFRDDNIEQLIEFTIAGSMRGQQTFRPGSIPLDLSSCSPFNISMLQLGLYRSTRYQTWQEPIVVVAGNTFEDFCLYYCLSRLREGVIWVLPSITERALGNNADAEMSRTESNFLYHVRNAQRYPQSEGKLGCLTHSLTSAQIDNVIEQLDRYGGGRTPDGVQKLSGIESLVQFPLTAVERDNLQRDISFQFVNDKSISLFATPKPKHFNPIHPYEHRYITQLSVPENAPPKHFDLGTYCITVPQYTTGELRVGKDGPAYFCPNIMYFGGDIDTVLVRPRLHLPPLHKILEELARTRKYECRPSDKGIYADESISKWGGLEQIGRFLGDASHRAFLDQFLDKSKSEQGKGVYLWDKRRYLDLSAIKSIVGDKSVPLIDELVAKEILYRGFVFGCSYCRNVDWFAVSDITQEFRCRRCRRSQVYAHRNWRDGDEPAWFYKLDELIYQGYQQGMAVPLLALDYLKRQSQESFTFTTDREFWRPEESKPDVEADFFCVPDGILTVGEAKSDNALGKGRNEEREKVAKYKRLVSGLSIRRVVFATTSPSWRNETVATIRRAFADTPHVRIVLLTASELL